MAVREVRADDSRKEAKTQRKQNLFVSCLERIPREIATPLHLPGEEKGSGDEVGKHAQFVFCEQHVKRQLSS